MVCEISLEKKEGVPMTNRISINKIIPYRTSFEVFKSNICHLVKDMGDIAFILDTLKNDSISELYERKWYPEAFYLLGMIDYLSNENDIPICNNYNHLRCQKLKEPVYPMGTKILDMAMNTNIHTEEAVHNAIPEFIRFNIVECEVRDVV